MPWLDRYRLQVLKQSTILPQRVLFNLPFFYYVKLVVVRLMTILYCCYSNTNMDLGCMTHTGTRSGFLGNALPPPLQYQFTPHFTINPVYQDSTFESHPVVRLQLVHMFGTRLGVYRWCAGVQITSESGPEMITNKVLLLLTIIIMGLIQNVRNKVYNMNHSNVLVNCVIAMHAVWEAYSPEILLL